MENGSLYLFVLVICFHNTSDVSVIELYTKFDYKMDFSHQYVARHAIV